MRLRSIPLAAVVACTLAGCSSGYVHVFVDGPTGALLTGDIFTPGDVAEVQVALLGGGEGVRFRYPGHFRAASDLLSSDFLVDLRGGAARFMDVRVAVPSAP